MSKVALALIALILLIFSAACSEPDRMGYVEIAAEEVCTEAERCGNIGSGGWYDSYSDCIIDQTSEFNRRWPESSCGGDRINADDFESCMNRARLAACDGGWDVISAWDRCRASRVCTN